jgi:hypothetical protein
MELIREKIMTSMNVWIWKDVTVTYLMLLSPYPSIYYEILVKQLSPVRIANSRTMF